MFFLMHSCQTTDCTEDFNKKNANKCLKIENVSYLLLVLQREGLHAQSVSGLRQRWRCGDDGWSLQGGVVPSMDQLGVEAQRE